MKLSLLFGFLGLAVLSPAQLLNITFDNPDPVVTRPASATTIVMFSGTVDVFDSSFDRLNVVFEGPYLPSGQYLFLRIVQEFASYVGDGFSPGLDYSGDMFWFEVTPSTPLGFYHLDGSLVTPSQLWIWPRGQSSSQGDNEAITVNVVPEPMTAGVFGLGIAFLGLRKRQKI